MALADRLFDLRKKAGQSLQTVADAVGVSKAHIWDLEKSQSSNPSFDLVQKLADHFGVTAATLTGATDAPSDAELQSHRIYRELKELSPRDRDLIESMIRSMHGQPANMGGE